ncbi:MAG: c-type cytochrome [Anaerolineae bacterium]
MNLQRLIFEKIESRILAGTVAFLALIAIIGWIAINEPGRMLAFENQYNGRAIERGAALFNTNCSTCHGTDGLGSARAPALNSPYLFGHDFFAAINQEEESLNAELNAAGTTDTRKDEINARLAELATERTNLTTRLAGTAQIPGYYDPARPSRLVNLGWTSTLHNFIYTTLVHGRPVSSNYWPQPMPAWSQTAGGPLRADELEDLTAYILNFDKGDNWTVEDLLSVRQFPIAPIDPATVPAGGAVEAVGTDVPAVVTELANYTGDPNNGQALYTSLACAGCHIGGAVGPATEGTWTRVNTDRLADPAVQALGITTGEEYLVHSILNPNEYVAPNYPSGIMPPTFGDRLGYQDLADLVSYLKSQDQ